MSEQPTEVTSEPIEPARAGAERAVRVGIGVSIANVLVYFASQVLPAEIMTDMENILVIGVAALIAGLGKWTRAKGATRFTP